ncbi:hypothetical protein HHI36_014122 [Cryptolaemus montrouzieri]|uniref:Uncharacterized protein n=1 Tax=Cryptolaemus montrouzieri TaxID=559131 RepID=A0ABD2N299_9CUCU
MDANDLWMELEQAFECVTAINNTTTNDHPKKPWITSHTWSLIAKRRELKGRVIADDNNKQKYSDLSKTIDRCINNDRNSYVTSICEEIEKHANSNQPRDLFKKV